MRSLHSLLHLSNKKYNFVEWENTNSKYRMKKLTVLLVALLALCSHEAMAWGSWAHRFITYTADKYLEPEVRSKVEHYLGSPMIDHCVWMDQIRKPIRKKDHPDHEAFQAYRPSLRWHHSVVDEKFRVSDARSKKGSGAMVPNLEKCIENLKNSDWGW